MIICCFGIVIDVPSDGNCGYHTVLFILATMGMACADTTISYFRKDLLLFAKKNESKFVGEKADGSDSVFKTDTNTPGFPWGDHRNQANPLDAHKTHFHETIV